MWDIWVLPWLAGLCSIRKNLTKDKDIGNNAEHLVQSLFGSLRISPMSSPVSLLCQPPGQETGLCSCIPACLLFTLCCLPSPQTPLSKNKQPCETCYSYFMDIEIEAQLNIARSLSNMVVPFRSSDFVYAMPWYRDQCEHILKGKPVTLKTEREGRSPAWLSFLTWEMQMIETI